MKKDNTARTSAENNQRRIAGRDNRESTPAEDNTERTAGRDNKERTSSKKITMCGLMLALALICIAAASFVPGIDLTIFAVSSVFIAAAVIEGGIGAGAAVYAGACILGFLIIPSKIGLIPFVMIFGLFPLVKYFIEKINKGWLQLLLKAIFFAASWSTGVLLFSELFIGDGSLSFMGDAQMPKAVFIAAGVLMLFVYDYILTYLIGFYIRRIHRLRMRG